MKPKKALYWHQGLFLQPQHLQYADQYHEALAHHYAACLSGVAQGISHLVIDEEALTGGTLVIKSLTCVLAGGTLVSVPDNAWISARTLDKAQFGNQSALPVYVALKLTSVQDDNVVFSDQPDSQNPRRYLCGPAETTRDALHPMKTTDMRLMNYHLKLVLGQEKESADDCLLMQIAQVVHNGQDFELDRRYIPDVLNIGASPVLKSAVRNLKAGLLSRVQLLDSYKNLGNSSDSSAGFNNRMALQLLSRYVPVLAHCEEVASTTPQFVFLTLRQLIGELSVFSNTVSVEGEAGSRDRSLPVYSSSNLSDCFAIAQELINTLLNELTVNPELVAQLARSDDSKYVATLNRDFFEERNMVYLTLSSAVLADESIEDFLHHAKLGADGQVDIYARRSLPGVEIKRLTGKPMGVTGGPNTHYFAIDRASYEWGYVSETGRAGLIWRHAPDDLFAQLVVVRG